MSVETLLNMHLPNLVILAATAIIIISLATRRLKNFKAGSVEINTAKEDRRMLIDIMNFTWALNNELYDGGHYYKRAARRIVKDGIRDYEMLLKANYLAYLKKEHPDDFSLTYATVCAELEGRFYVEQMSILMELYEHNHITHLTDPELRVLAQNTYEQISLRFRDCFAGKWDVQMLDYDSLARISQDIAPEVLDMIYDVIVGLRNTLHKVYVLRGRIQEVRSATSVWISENGPLPVSSMAIVSTFFEEGSGLNDDAVEAYLKSIRT